MKMLTSPSSRWFGVLALVLVAIGGCESPTEGGDPDTTIVPPRGRRGVGVPVLTEPEFESFTASATPLEMPLDGRVRDLSSAPDGLVVRMVGEFSDPSDPCSRSSAAPVNYIPGIWSASTGWTALPRRTGGEYTANAIGDGGHVVGFWGTCGGGSLVVWRSTSEVEVRVSGMMFGGINSYGEVIGSEGGTLALYTVGDEGQVTEQPIHIELLRPLGYVLSWGVDINDRGQILGYGATDSSGDPESWDAFIIDGDVVHILDLESETFIEPVALNNADPVQAVGFAPSEEAYSEKAYRWTLSSDESILVERLPNPEGYQGSVPEDIDDTGEVLGFSIIDGAASWIDASTVLWTTSGGAPAVTIVDPGHCMDSHLDNFAALAGLTRVLTCNRVHELEIG